MRLDRLELIRYGRFTDRCIDLPAAEHDFHVLVGPNEAGKSTVRAAVLDLLYGIPKNTPHAFVHPMPEMRLGARLAQGAQTLALQRVKGNRQTLRDIADQPLADDILAPYLGSTDRVFFGQMFALDHARLVQGGDSILSAANDLGQILFQSAAGIVGLGAIRDDLQAQADSLWSRRRSGERRYYMAADELERATAALKQATVRTRDWSEAQARFAELDGAHVQVRREHDAVKQRRNRLDRVRRVAPHLRALDDAAARLAGLGSVVELAPGAGKVLADANAQIALAQAEIVRQGELMRAAQAVLDGLHVDAQVRAAGAEIEQLNEQRLQYRAYPGDIARRQAEIDAQWTLVCTLAAQSGWDTGSEASVRAQLPSAAVRSALGRLVRTRAAIEQALVSCERALKAKQAEIAQARAELAALPDAEMPLGLQAALARAQKLGDHEAGLEERRKALHKQQSTMEAAFAALGAWRCEAGALRAMAVPAADIIRSLAQQQVNDDAQARALSGRITVLEQQARQARLEVAQYRNAHQAVTLDEVLQARHARDATWQEIRSEPAALAERVPVFERQLAAADTLADRRHDTIQQASELQARVAQAERVEHELESQQQALAQLRSQADQRAQRWSALADGCGLPALPFEAAAPWLEARAAALAAAQARDEAQAALDALETAVAEAGAALASELRRAAVAAESGQLAVLVLAATRCVQAAAAASGQRRTLEKQVADAERDVLSLADAWNQARAGADAWARQWAQRLADAGRDPASDVPAVENMLDAAEKIDAALAAMRHTQADRIDTMRADLDAHGAAARALADRLAPGLAQLAAADIVVELVSRLALANEAYQESERQRAVVQEAQQRLDDAMGKRVQAQAALAPLLHHAGLSRIEELAGAIERSDRWRACMAECTAAEQEVREAGDGMSPESLRAEAATVDLASVRVQLEDLEREDNELVNRLADLSARRQAARTALEAIGGSADAARAEAQRQQALASMADVVERYVKVFTAARLLRWSIDQYREARQGPMLSAASAIFARLTLGSFDKLVVDFEQDPPKLLGRRPDGATIRIEGMSEGTRDQLYLALRLAALDLHLGHAQVLPFIADDLFINYDDARSASGLQALAALSRKTQVLFLTHHDHLLPAVQQVFGAGVNIVRL